MNPDKSVKRKKFLDKDNIADMAEYVGVGLDMEAEFEELDKEKKGKVKH